MNPFTFFILTDKCKGRNVVLTRSVIRKRNPLDPLEYADYEPIIPEEDEIDIEITHSQNEYEEQRIKDEDQMLK